MMINAGSWNRSAIGALAACASLLLLASSAEARQEREGDEMARMQKEIEELRAQLRALKEQIDALSRTGPTSPAPAPFAEASPPAAAQAPVRPALPAPGSPGGGTVFNPAIGTVFQGIGTGSFNHDRDEDGFTLSEAELSFQAAVDPYARVDLFLAFGAEGEAEVEEGYVTFQTLPGGLQAKAGRFKNAFGKWNTLHDHQFFTVDQPDILTSFFGEESLASEGASLSWLVPGTGPVYVEAITEVASTGNDTFFNARRRDPLLLERVTSVFTLTPNATIEFGASAVTGKGGPSERLLEEIDAAGLTGTLEPSDRLASSAIGADVTYKWKPVQFNVYRSVTWQTELLRSARRVERLDLAGGLAKETVRRLGGYSYAEYQFAKRWRAGLRYDHARLPDDDRGLQRAISAVLRIQPSEFQEFRIQFKHTGRDHDAALRFDGTRADNELFVEWIPAIGAHAAHKY